MKIIDIIADQGHADTIRGIAEQYEVTDCWVSTAGEDERCIARIIVPEKNTQDILDALQGFLGSSERARISVMPTDVVLPRPKKSEDDEKKEKARTLVASRESLYNSIEKNSHLDGNYLLLVFLSTIVAAIGLIENNVAVVIGAMVIAPLLGPNLALALGTSLGDKQLAGQSFITSMAGLLVAIGMSFLIPHVWDVPLNSQELLARTNVGLDSVALALASGAAAALSITGGLPSVLVGVMVAVALLPPSATFGIMLGAGNYNLATGAGLLLAVNIVSVNLSAKIVFLIRGIRPRTWLEKKQAKQSMTIYILIWILTLIFLLSIIYLRSK